MELEIISKVPESSALNCCQMDKSTQFGNLLKIQDRSLTKPVETLHLATRAAESL